MRPYLEEFEAFWCAYPKRAGNPKEPARKQWMRLAHLNQLPPLEDMVAAAKAYAAHIKRENITGEFIAHTRTWLFQKRFDDWKPQKSDQPRPQVIPDVMVPVFKALGDDRYLSHFGTCLFEDEGDVLVIRPRYRFMVDRIPEGLVARLTGRRVRVEMAA